MENHLELNLCLFSDTPVHLSYNEGSLIIVMALFLTFIVGGQGRHGPHV